jgi:hypothetical protein
MAKDLTAVLDSIAQHSIADNDFPYEKIPDNFCTWCFQPRTQIHICDCSSCGAPFGYCTHANEWKTRRLN